MFCSEYMNDIYIYYIQYCRASHTGVAIGAMYSSVSVGVVHVLCACARRYRAQCDVLVIPQLVTILPSLQIAHFRFTCLGGTGGVTWVMQSQRGLLAFFRADDL